MNLTHKTMADLLAMDAVIGRELDSTRRGGLLPQWTDGAYRAVLAEHQEVRDELKRRRAAQIVASEDRDFIARQIQRLDRVLAGESVDGLKLGMPGLSREWCESARIGLANTIKA